MRVPVQLLKSRRGKPRGQAMILSCLTLLLLALMMMLSYSVNQVIHERIRLQQHADSVAYSLAVIEARAFNYIAYTNRAQAAAFVAMNTLDAEMAAASVTAEMLNAAHKNFIWIGVLEFAQCNSIWTIRHCWDGIQAFGISGDFANARDEYYDKIQSLESPFENSAKALDLMLDTIHASQVSVVSDTANVLRGGDVAERLRQINAPQSQTALDAVGALSAAELSCAVDGMPCSRSGASDDARASVMTAVVNGTRPSWVADRSGAPLPTYLDPRFLEDLMHGIQGSGLTWINSHAGTAKMVASANTGDLTSGQQAKDKGSTSGAMEKGSLGSQWRHAAWPLTNYEVSLFADKDGGDHSSSGHTGTHQFQGVNAAGQAQCVGQNNCFFDFRISDDPKIDFGQPHVFAYVTQSLRTMQNGKRGPWELNDEGTVKFEGMASQSAQLRMVPDKDGSALSYALVYYHRLGDWREQPNFFGPFWRAKLHPMTADAARNALMAAGQTDAAQLTGLNGIPLD